jgi:hypothetical protein
MKGTNLHPVLKKKGRKVVRKMTTEDVVTC